jgi:predicted DNA-binding transcriptional regulator YafY
MLHFANYEKTTAQTEAKRYKMELTYYRDDETEVLIRILSFGPLVKVISPESFIDQIKERLKRQKNLITAVPEK